VRLFGRREPLHRQLADDAGLSLGLGETPPGPAAAPPGWDGEQRGEPGIHGVPRARRWDAVVVADAPGLQGNAVHFVVLGDGVVVVDEDEPDGTVAPLADAVETRLAPPYRAEAVRKGATTWGVAARRIALVAEPGLDGEQVELVVSREGRSLVVDGQQRVSRAPALEAAGTVVAPEFVVRAQRVDDGLWEVEATPL
jgi:hypothetical protein